MYTARLAKLLLLFGAASARWFSLLFDQGTVALSGKPPKIICHCRKRLQVGSLIATRKKLRIRARFEACPWNLYFSVLIVGFPLKRDPFPPHYVWAVTASVIADAYHLYRSVARGSSAGSCTCWRPTAGVPRILHT